MQLSFAFDRSSNDRAPCPVTARGQVIFRKDILQHLGVQPGDKIKLHTLPGGKVALSAACPNKATDKLIAQLAGRMSKVATIE